ncbi:hypothetical protein [Xanthomonas phage XPV2]|nr:hypothetical protein [Xanthomonas phage XPV2]
MNTYEGIGQIQFVLFDAIDNEVVILGQLAFTSRGELDAAWTATTALDGFSDFAADLVDGTGEVVETKFIAARTAERALGASIRQLAGAACHNASKASRALEPDF